MENKASNPMQQPEGGEGSASQRHWQEVLAAFNTSDYERVSDLLRVIGMSDNLADQTELIKIALQVCLACIHSRSEVEWHRRAGQEADERERELRQGLETILAAIIKAKVVWEPTLKKRLPRHILSPPSREKSTSEIRKSPSIWERIQALLGFRPEHASSTEYENILPPLKEDEHLSTPHIEKEKRLDHAIAEVERVAIDDMHGIEDDAPLLVVYCLGTFRVYQDEQPIEDWPSSKGKAIFKYLLAHRERPVAKEILMDLFWSDSDPDSARNNLNVAIYGLRQALRNGRREFSHVLFQNDSYQFNPQLKFWIDYEGFMRGIQTAQSLERKGELAQAIYKFTSAEALYQGEFLEEDRYEDWLVPQRRRLQDEYLNLLERLTRHFYDHHDLTNCANLCLKMLAIDPCREEAHRRLMRCYYQQGQSYLSLRQYHLCFEALKKDLDIVPSTATSELYELIRRQNRG